MKETYNILEKIIRRNKKFRQSLEEDSEIEQ